MPFMAALLDFPRQRNALFIHNPAEFTDFGKHRAGTQGFLAINASACLEYFPDEFRLLA